MLETSHLSKMSRAQQLQIGGTDCMDVPPWDCDQYPDSASIKLEPSSDGFELCPQSGSDFAELKPMPFDYESTTLTGVDPVLASPASGLAKTRSVVSSSTSSSPQPAGITKLETLDFTASQDAFDDLASIVGISMGADSTVPSIDSDLDLDAWIENTAQNIRPLMAEAALDSIILPSSSSVSALAAATTVASVMPRSYAYVSAAGGTTLQNLLLHGNLSPLLPSAMQTSLAAAKNTQLQHRQTSVTPAAVLQVQQPPPYSILQNRLLQQQQQQQHGGGIIKVDSTFDLMKIADSNGNTYLATNSSAAQAAAAAAAAAAYADSMPHSTQQASQLTHVSTSDASLHRRMGDIGGLVKIKSGKQSKARAQKLLLGAAAASAAAAASSSGSPPNSGSLSPVASGGGGSVMGSGGLMVDANGKKMMHHCQICNRGFLNKSNIKVHLRTHTGEKPFKCEHCSKAFRQKAHLLKHMSIHKRISRD